ncbi:MAG TPA: substrate-binding domain-containing protein [Lachnospiraceae bacterium]|nr:substrate-binding domain-containing protein [Lachnospiraceae bacterium]
MEKKTENRFSRKEKILTGTLVSLTIVMLLTTLIGLIYFKQQIAGSNLKDEEQYNEYERQYVLITKDIDDTFWDSVYEEMKEAGDETGVYVERLGRNLSMEYSKNDLMEIAIDSHVDGIILEADESDETAALINKADAEGIPVVTIMRDAMGTTRKSFVGISNYNLGSEYGKLIVNASKELQERSAPEGNDTDQGQTLLPDPEAEADPVQVLILIDKNSTDTSQNIIYTAIQEELEKEGFDKSKAQVDTAAISNDGAFSAEESIRDIFQNSEYQPDVIVCLNELNTKSIYQTVVDQNKVGQIMIIGYYDSETILRAVQRKVIYATITVNTKQMGSYCVKALNEYIDTGHVSDYFSVDFTLIDKDNVNEYLRSLDDNE